MTSIRNPVLRRRLKRLIPYFVVALVGTTMVISAISYNIAPREKFNFNVYWPSPSSYYPGVVLPNAYLQINFTSSGQGNYTYIITYNASSGAQVAGHGNVLVSHMSPFTAYFNIPTSHESVVVATAKVYHGSPVPQNLVYSKSISL